MSLPTLVTRTVVSAIIVFVIGSLFYLKFQRSLKFNLATIVSIFWSLVAGLLLTECIFSFPDPKNPLLITQALLAAIGGASLGWVLGMWISPMGNSESVKFGKYWTAIGVGSGFTLKWAFDKVVDHFAWFRGHWFVTTVSVIACLVTAAAVYNSRAYNDALDISVHLTPGNDDVSGADPVKIKASKQAQFYAAVTGPSDPCVRWEVFPVPLPNTDPIGKIDSLGLFVAGATAGKGKITAFNLEDPTLSNFIEIEVV